MERLDCSTSSLDDDDDLEQDAEHARRYRKMRARERETGGPRDDAARRPPSACETPACNGFRSRSGHSGTTMYVTHRRVANGRDVPGRRRTRATREPRLAISTTRSARARGRVSFREKPWRTRCCTRTLSRCDTISGSAFAQRNGADQPLGLRKCRLAGRRVSADRGARAARPVHSQAEMVIVIRYENIE